MRFTHPGHPGRAVRLAYCLNLHAGETLEAVRTGIESITLPLRDRLADGAAFGVGAYLPASVALALADDADARDALAGWLADERLDAFTFNAFPYGGFHRDGLKADVYRPTWQDPARAAYTVAVARFAVDCRRASGRPADEGHVSISTHPGGYAAFSADEPDGGAATRRAYGRGLALAAQDLAELESAGGPRIVLSVEAEPQASAGTSEALGRQLLALRPALDGEVAGDVLDRHLGTCLDACHAAVEFEAPKSALAAACFSGPVGKLQFSSALELVAPAERPEAVAALLALDEPRYLHQVVGRAAGDKLHAADLPALRAELDATPAPWLACDAWRCHFHVPVGLEGLEGLGTTLADADALLEAALAAPARWGSDELHVEIETYTWDVLPAPARGEGDLVDGLEQEYRHVLGTLERAGWRRDDG